MYADLAVERKLDEAEVFELREMSNRALKRLRG